MPSVKTRACEPPCAFGDKTCTRKGSAKQPGGLHSMENGQQPYCDYLALAQAAKLKDASSPHDARRVKRR